MHVTSKPPTSAATLRTRRMILSGHEIKGRQIPWIRGQLLITPIKRLKVRFVIFSNSRVSYVICANFVLLHLERHKILLYKYDGRHKIFIVYLKKGLKCRIKYLQMRV